MTVVLTVWCGQCVAERRRSPERLGVVEADDGGEVWRTEDRRKGRNLKAGSTPWTRFAVQALATPHASNATVPDRLHAVCKVHGAGSVSTSDVIGKRGSVVLNLIATA